jgi:general stress protein 26
VTRDELLSFLRRHRYAVQASVSPTGTPQAALVGVAVSDAFEIVFDTLSTSRKALNLASRGNIALVFGSTAPDADRTVQIEGMADILKASASDQLVALYLSLFPDGVERQAASDLIYVRVTPNWIRDSDFTVTPPRLEEWDAKALAALA